MPKTRRNKMKYNTTKKKYTYNKSEYNSSDGMLTTVWGPAMWHYLHTMSFNYPVNPTLEDKQQYRDFILSLQYVLPCKYCRINLTNNFKKKPLQMCHMLNRNTFSNFIFINDEGSRVIKILFVLIGLSLLLIKREWI